MPADAIQRDLLSALDPVFFARIYLGIQPDERQSKVLRCRAKQVILNCSRQWGKSTVCSILALHQAYYYPMSLVLVVSPTLRQSGELLRKILQYLPALGLKKKV